MTRCTAVSQCGHTANRPGDYSPVVSRTVGSVTNSCNVIGCRICRAGFNSWFEGFLKSPYFSFLKGPHSFNIDLRTLRF